GQTIYLKLPAFNIFGQGLQSLAALSPYSLTLNGDGTDPLSNPIVAALAAGTGEDWGTVGTSLIGAADLGSVIAPVGAAINLGTVPSCRIPKYNWPAPVRARSQPIPVRSARSSSTPTTTRCMCRTARPRGVTRREPRPAATIAISSRRAARP